LQIHAESGTGARNDEPVGPRAQWIEY